MNERDQRLVTTLIREIDFTRPFATAFVEARGRCTWCGTDLLRNRTAYASSRLDQLLPPDRYPDFAAEEQNLVLSCASCSELKGEHDYLRRGEDAVQVLRRDRDGLIQRIREALRPRIEHWDAVWRQVNRVMDAE